MLKDHLQTTYNKADHPFIKISVRLESDFTYTNITFLFIFIKFRSSINRVSWVSKTCLSIRENSFTDISLTFTFFVIEMVMVLLPYWPFTTLGLLVPMISQLRVKSKDISYYQNSRLINYYFW